MDRGVPWCVACRTPSSGLTRAHARVDLKDWHVFCLFNNKTVLANVQESDRVADVLWNLADAVRPPSPRPRAPARADAPRARQANWKAFPTEAVSVLPR